MNMHTIDWAIVATLLTALTIGAITTKRYTTSVSSFMAAERSGGRYLISIAMGMAQLGVISLVWLFQQNYDVGFTSIWWGLMGSPFMIIMGISGWIIYRFRQTQALTLAQFFEMRYSRNLRVFSGLLAFFSGILNFGIFPSVGANFFIAFCGLPTHFQLPLIGQASSFVCIMILLLSIALLFTFIGGQLAIMVTDFIQGTFSNIIFLLVIAYILYYFNWGEISETLLSAPAGKSCVNPWDLGKEENFNILFYFLGVFIMFYGAMSWQGTAGYNCSAKSAHESKMAGILSQWRWRVLMLITLVIPIGVKTYMNHPNYAERAKPCYQAINQQKERELERRINTTTDKYHLEQYQQLRTITTEQIAEIKSLKSGLDKDISTQKEEYNRLDDIITKYNKIEQVESQLRAPIVLGHFLPPVLLGLLCAALLAAFISTHDTYLHSWGTMFVQDVILPFKKKELSPKSHLWLLRAGIFMVAIFIFTFSYYFEHAERIAMYCNRSAAVFIGGAGIVIIGGLYWKKGTTAGAWAALLTGMSLATSSIIIGQLSAENLANAKEMFIIGDFIKIVKYFNGQEYAAIVIVICIVLYIVISLVTCKEDFNLDKMLHKGKYATGNDKEVEINRKQTIWEKIGFSSEFTKSDYIIAAITFSWPIFWFIFFVGVNSWHLFIKKTTDNWWASYWHVWTIGIFIFGIIITIWFTIGGFIDMKYLFKQLRICKDKIKDDGRVTHGHNLSDEE